MLCSEAELEAATKVLGAKERIAVTVSCALTICHASF